jgi:hypothetical protein
MTNKMYSPNSREINSATKRLATYDLTLNNPRSVRISILDIDGLVMADYWPNVGRFRIYDGTGGDYSEESCKTLSAAIDAYFAALEDREEEAEEEDLPVKKWPLDFTLVWDMYKTLLTGLSTGRDEEDDRLFSPNGVLGLAEECVETIMRRAEGRYNNLPWEEEDDDD